MTAQVEPKCTCGHESDEHTYHPSGMLGTECFHCDMGYNENGWALGPVCKCSDYTPEGSEDE